MAVGQRRVQRERRKKRAKKQIQASARPRLTVFRSSKHLYAQIVDPLTGRTLVSVSTRSPQVRSGLRSTKDLEAAKKVGAAIAQRALEKDVRQVVFNRNGFVFHGRVKAIAEAAREAGLGL